MTKPPVPTISRLLSDGTLIELVFDAEARTTQLALCPPIGPSSLIDQLTLPNGELLVPYAASNNLLSSGCVLLPSEHGELGSKEKLLSDLKAFIHRYVSFSPLFEDIAAHYVMLSWVYEAFNEVPYLRLSGEYGSGKTRALLVLGSLAHKGFFDRLPDLPCAA